jgi:hypothetical protein
MVKRPCVWLIYIQNLGLIMEKNKETQISLVQNTQISYLLESDGCTDIQSRK